MNNDIVKKGSDFEVLPLQTSRYTFNSANQIPVNEPEVLKICENGKLCNPIPEFEMIEKCKDCGKTL